jgi:ADP-ribose pyrophosphatase YjhB (NUDIX family)
MVWTPRVTVAAVVEDDGRFLMVEETTPGGLVFNQPAGHLEAGESLLEAVRREVLEETACEVEPTALVGVYRWPMPDASATYLRFCFAARLRAHHPDRALDADVVAAHWLEADAIRRLGPRLRSPLVLACLDDALERPTTPLELLRDIND